MIGANRTGFVEDSAEPQVGRTGGATAARILVRIFVRSDPGYTRAGGFADTLDSRLRKGNSRWPGELDLVMI